MRRRRTTTPHVALALGLILALAAGPAMAATSDEPDASSAAASTFAGSDIADIAAALDYDLERIFRYVADGIHYEPYVGRLRGPTGTVTAGAGNSVDQAVLLAALLDESLIPFRYAQGTLDEAAADELLAASVLDPAELPDVVAARLTGDLESVPPPEDPSEVDAEQIAAIDEAAEASLQRGSAMTVETVDMLEAALAEAGVALGDGRAAVPPLEREAHTWVQVASGADWVDLDPTVPGNASGVTLTEPVTTLDALPDELRHSVTFEVLLERVRSGRLATEPVVELTAFADELTSPIAFSHIEPAGIEALGLSIGNLLGEADLTYHPVLQGSNGSIVADIPVSFGLRGGENGGGLLDDEFFDDGGPADAAAPADGEASAEWLQVTVTSPGAEPVIERRTIFDRLSPEDRLAGVDDPSALEPVELTILGDSAIPQFTPMLGLRSLAVTTGATTLPDILDVVSDAHDGGIGGLAMSYVGVRDTLAVESSPEVGVRTFVARPGVTSFVVDVRPEGDDIVVTSGLDIWQRSLDAIELDGAPVTAARGAMAAGVVEHIAERMAMEVGPSVDGIEPVHVGVATVFEVAAETGVPTLVLRDTLAPDAPYDAASKAAIQAALDEGDVVIVPAEAVPLDGRERLGWWRIDPLTGVTSDRMDDGTASVTVERIILAAQRAAICIVVFAPAYFTVMNGIMDGLAGSISGVAAGFYTGYWIVKNKALSGAVTACLKG